MPTAHIRSSCSRRPRLTRRRFLTQSAGVGASLFAGATMLGHVTAQEASPDASPEASPAGDGSWSFTDDRGVTVTLPKRPERVFADISAAAPLWDFGIRPIAISGFATTNEVAWGNIDRSIEVINADAGYPDAERLLELQPDIYVSITWRPDDPTSVWGLPDENSVDLFNSIAPIICISATGLADVSMQRFAELAGLLGADFDAPELVMAKDDYDMSVEAFSAMVAEKADLDILFAYVGSEAEWYVANADAWADLAFYRKLGMNILEPDVAEGEYWEGLSREQALKYPADIFFNSTREGMFDAEQLQADPAFGQHPAIKAGQIGRWNQDFIMSYQGLSAALDSMTETLAESHKLA